MNLRMKLWVVLTLLATTVAANAQAAMLGIGNMEVINTVIASILLPFFASIINKSSMSGNQRGAIALVLSIVFAVGAQFVSNGLRFDLLDADGILVSFGAIIGISQGIHRTLKGQLDNIEKATESPKEPTEPKAPVNQTAATGRENTTPPAVKPTTSIVDAAKAAGVAAAQNEITTHIEDVERKIDVKVERAIEKLLGNRNSLLPEIAGRPVSPDVDLSDVDETGVMFEEEEVPQQLYGTIELGQKQEGV